MCKKKCHCAGWYWSTRIYIIIRKKKKKKKPHTHTQTHTHTHRVIHKNKTKIQNIRRDTHCLIAVAMLSRSWVSSSYRMISVWGTDMVSPPWYAGLNLGAGLMTVRMSVCMCRCMCCLIMAAISNSNWCWGMRGSHGGTFFSEAGRRKKSNKYFG